MKINIKTTKTINVNDKYTFVIFDDTTKKQVEILIHGTMLRFLLWEGAAYDAAGDYTQAQVNTAVAEWLAQNAA